MDDFAGDFDYLNNIRDKGPRDVSLKDRTLLNIMMMLSLKTDFGSPKKKCGAISSRLPLWDDHTAGQKKAIRNDITKHSNIIMRV